MTKRRICIALCIVIVLTIVVMIFYHAFFAEQTNYPSDNDKYTYIANAGTSYINMIFPTAAGMVLYNNEDSYLYTNNYYAFDNELLYNMWDCTEANLIYEDGIISYSDDDTMELFEQQLKAQVIYQSQYLYPTSLDVDWQQQEGYYQAFFATNGLTLQQVMTLCNTDSMVCSVAYRSTALGSADAVALHVNVGSFTIEKLSEQMSQHNDSYQQPWASSDLVDIAGLSISEQLQYLYSNRTNSDELIIGVSVIGTASMLENIADSLPIVAMYDLGVA